MTLTLAQAAEATGRSRSTLLRAIRKGAISASRDEAGGFLVDEAELARVFTISSPDAANGHALPSLDAALAKPDAAETRISDKDAVIDDLRRRLDQADTDRRQALDRLAAAQERIAALLTDQRAMPARRWWKWGRRG
jgi:hypothetical protein